jgi:hypothetical protein
MFEGFLYYYTVISMIWPKVWVNNVTFVITHCIRLKNFARPAYSTVTLCCKFVKEMGAGILCQKPLPLSLKCVKNLVEVQQRRYYFYCCTKYTRKIFNNKYSNITY